MERDAAVSKAKRTYSKAMVWRTRNPYYYRLRKVREAACTLLEQSEEKVSFAEVPFEKAEENHSAANIRILFSGAVVDICSPDTATLETILKVLSHAE